MLKIAFSCLLNAQIARTAIWISSWTLYFFICGVGSSWLAWRARLRQLGHPHRAEAWDDRRRGEHHSPLLLVQELLVPVEGLAAQGSLVELISFAYAPPTGLVWTKLRCTLQAHNVAIGVAQHFGKVVVKSVFSEGCFRRYWRRDIEFYSSSLCPAVCRTKLHQTSWHQITLQRPRNHSSFLEPCTLIV